MSNIGLVNSINKNVEMDKSLGNVTDDENLRASSFTIGRKIKAANTHTSNQRSAMKKRLRTEEEKEDEKEEAEVVSGEAYEHDGIRLSTLKSVPNHFSLVSKENIT